MMGFKEDLLFAVTSWIQENWEPLEGNVAYMAAQVKKSGLTVGDLSDYLAERGKACPASVITVFDYIINPLEKEGGEQ